MRVLHVAPYISPVRGGISQAVLEMLQALREQGVAAELITTNDDGVGLLDVPLNQHVEYHTIPTRFFPRYSPNIAAIREFQYSWELSQWLWQHMHEYDLVHIHAMFCYPCTIAMMIARIKNIPYLNQPHGLLCEWSLQQSALKKQIYLALIEKSNLEHSQALQVTSVMEDQEIAQLNLTPQRIHIPLGLVLAPLLANARQQLCQQLQIPETHTIVLFMSRLHPKKGLDYLVPALGQLRDQEFTFILAGSGSAEYEAEVDQQLTHSGIQQHTRRTGFVSGELKQLLLQGSDLFVLTSHSENFGVVVLEAMAAGLAPILTPGVAMSSVLKEHDVGFVPELEIEAIAHTIRYCLEHPTEIKAIGSRAQSLILQHYTWERIGLKIQQTYAQMLTRPKVICPLLPTER
jgi:glycosyltransferase involved in cell wall biosynthesis